MKKRMTIASLLLAAASLMLGACGSASEEQSETGEKTIFVGPQLVDCVGAAPQQCMQVKEDPQAEYTLFYDTIEGFEYEAGYEYELLIKEEPMENPPADGSSLRWTLIDEVSKTPVKTTAIDAPPQTEEADTSASGEEVTVYVGPELVECVGVAPQNCMQVKTNPEDDYTLFYDQIEGFEFEPGNEYELLVLIEPVENPPADGSSLKHTLIEEVSKTAVSAGSAAAVGGTGSALEGPTWALLSYVAPDGQPADVLPDSRITAEFKEGQLSGTAGCNRYFGSYEADGSLLTIGPAGSTMMFCSPEEIMMQETAYLATLSGVISYEIVDGQLHMKNANDDRVLLFAAEEPLSLTSVDWNIVSYNNGKEAMVSVIFGTEITASFGEDGVLSGSAGCNSYSGGYESEGSSITIGTVASSQMFCMEPEGIMEQETQYLAALKNAAGYRIDGTRLEIRDANGSGVAYYEAAKPVTLTGETWNLLFHNNGKGGMVSTIVDTQISAIFDETGNLGGSSGCNTYSATYEADGEQITIGPAATTRMFCTDPEGIMEQESQYLAALENAAIFAIEGNRLEIRDVNGSGVASYEALDETSETDSAETGGDSGDVPPEIMSALGNTSYPLDYTGSGAIQLTDGEYRQPAAEDSSAEIVTQLTNHVAIGETTAGEEIVATILVSQTGGTGTFYDLAVLREADGQLGNPTTTYLGDRIVINSLTIENGQIVVDMVVQGPEDPFCCPTQRVIQTYALQGEILVQVSSEALDPEEAQALEMPDITGIVWKWQELITPVEQVTIDHPEKYTVEFKDGGLLSVTADCNVGGGTYEIVGQSISISITSTTLALCAEGSRGDLFFSSLNNASIYFMDGDDLMMDQFADGGTMRFFD